MFDEDAFRRLADESLTILARLQTFRRLFKTEGGHLTGAGKAVIAEGHKAGLTTTEIANLLDVNTAVVRYHSRAITRPQQLSHNNGNSQGDLLAA